LPSRLLVKGGCFSWASSFETFLKCRCSPYFGQSSWFQFQHSEKIPSAIERYNNEIRRVFGVLDSVLAKQKYLVGDKVTVADLAFITWNVGALTKVIPDVDAEKNYPALAR
jgi:glutathione S-transferase